MFYPASALIEDLHTCSCWCSVSAGCSKRLFSEAAGESKPEAYPQGYVEDFDEPRTKLADFFSILLVARRFEVAGRPVLPWDRRLFGLLDEAS